MRSRWLSLVVGAAAVACGADTEIALAGGAASDASVDAAAGAGGATPDSGSGGSTGGAAACVNSTQCTGERPFCAQTVGRCVECLLATHCEQGQACDPSGSCSLGCSSPSDCGSGGETTCDPTTGACVQCLTKSDCTSSGEPFCVLGHCAECAGDVDCPAGKPYCSPDSHECNECLVDGHCPAGQSCSVDEHKCTSG